MSKGAKEYFNEKLFTIDPAKLTTKKHLYKLDISLPEAPPDKDCINYGVPILEQKFQRTVIPHDLRKWSKPDMEEFIRREYHKRYNGIWIFIKGQKWYIPGVCYYFLNYWHTQKGGLPDFYITDVELYQFWFHCVYTPGCLGMLDMKSRRVGDTEKAICMIYEYASRVRNKICGMQSCVNQDNIEATFDRVVKAHTKMIWFMKPINKGNDKPGSVVEFEYPEGKNTTQKLLDKTRRGVDLTEVDVEYEYEALRSVIEFAASRPSHYDGGEQGRYYNDEWGKAESAAPSTYWKHVKKCMFSKGGEQVGKSMWTSTVEEMKTGLSLVWARKLWDASDPNDPNNTTGLFRCFRSSLEGAKADDWGFPRKEEHLAWIKAEIAKYLANDDISGMVEFQRQEPLEEEDCFSSVNDESNFNVANLKRREWEVSQSEFKVHWQRGDLKWKDDIRDTIVVFIPNPNGHFWIHKHPENFGFKNNAKHPYGSKKIPYQTEFFVGGIDPYDQKTKNSDDVSDGGIAIRRRYDPDIDDKKEKWELDDNNFPVPIDGGRLLETGRYVLSYKHRHDNPNAFFEDCIMAMVYFSCGFLYEKNRGAAFRTYIETRGYQNYFLNRPKATNGTTRPNTEEEGMTASEGTIDAYFSFLQTETSTHCNTIYLPPVLTDLCSMNMKNRGTKDLGVACGYSLVAEGSPYPKYSQRYSEGVEEEEYHNTYLVDAN